MCRLEARVNRKLNVRRLPGGVDVIALDALMTFWVQMLVNVLAL